MYPLLNGEGAFGVTALSLGAPGAEWTNTWLVKSPNQTEATPTMPAGTSVVGAESSTPIAAQIRSLVAAAVAGVVIQP